MTGGHAGAFADQSSSMAATYYGKNMRSSEKKNRLQDQSYTYTLQQPFQGHNTNGYEPNTGAFGYSQVQNKYHETSSEFSGEDDVSETSDNEDDYDGEEAETPESSFTDYNMQNDNVFNRYQQFGHPQQQQQSMNSYNRMRNSTPNYGNAYGGDISNNAPHVYHPIQQDHYGNYR